MVVQHPVADIIVTCRQKKCILNDFTVDLTKTSCFLALGQMSCSCLSFIPAGVGAVWSFKVISSPCATSLTFWTYSPIDGSGVKSALRLRPAEKYRFRQKNQ